MKTLIAICSLLLLLAAGCRPAAGEAGKKFYVQLVRGNDEAAPPAPDARAVGAKLTDRLQSVLRWKHYWELRRDSLVLPCGHKVRKRISSEREVEIELSPSQSIAVRVYLDGRLSQSRTQPASGAFFITGGDRGRNQSWFIVVRDDQPLDPGRN